MVVGLDAGTPNLVPALSCQPFPRENNAARPRNLVRCQPCIHQSGPVQSTQFVVSNTMKTRHLSTEKTHQALTVYKQD